jgi:hypothetical protein
MDLNSTTTAAPIQDKVQVEELIRSDEFLNEIMGNMAKSVQEPVQKLETGNRSEAVALGQAQDSAQPQFAEQQVESTQGNQQENIQSATQETSAGTQQTNQADTFEKRWRDSQAMIGRQSNEIGLLRKKQVELEQKLNTVQPEDSEPYYEKLVKASEDQIAQLLLKEAQDRNEELDPHLARQQARTLKTSARIQMDIVKDAMRPIQKISEDFERNKQIAQKDADWYKVHPEAAKRQQAMKQFIDSAYPDGLAMKNEYGEVIGMKADPYVVAHMAYEYAGKVINTTQQTVENLENQRIAAGRSLNTATQGTVPGQSIQQPKKQDALTAETSRVFEQDVLPKLARMR